jgi:AraC-like DNA-binding protein
MRATTKTPADVDEAQKILDRHFYASSVDVLEPPSGWRARFEVTPPGPVTLGTLEFGVDVRARFGELGAYHVDVPLSGVLSWTQGSGGPRIATSDAAAVFQPVGDTTLERWAGGCRLIAVKIESTVLENTLAELIDAPVRALVRLGPTLDLSRGAGAGWLRLLRLITADTTHPGGLLHHPLLGARLRESLVTGLLLAAEHPYRDRLDRPLPPVAPRSIRRVADAMHADPAQPYTVADLAALAGISPRGLQQGFHRHLGMPPMAYLRGVRLARAHEALREAGPGGTTVASIAHRFGFTHLGRFAADYRSRYGVTPARTLRG